MRVTDRGVVQVYFNLDGRCVLQTGGLCKSTLTKMVDACYRQGHSFHTFILVEVFYTFNIKIYKSSLTKNTLLSYYTILLHERYLREQYVISAPASRPLHKA